MAETKIDYKEFSLDELNQTIQDSEQDMVKLKFNHAISPIENPMVMRELRRNIARMKTEFRRRALEA